MKIIQLFLLLSLGLWAEFKLDISNEIDSEQLQFIVEKGWNDKNETLNQSIINYGAKVFPDVLKKMEKPIIEVEPTKENPAPMPRIILNRDDYRFIFSYLKYLEFVGDSSKAQEVYSVVLKGLSDIKDRSSISMIYRLVIEKMIVNSLDQAIQAKRFSQLQIKEIKNRMKQYLLLDNKILWNNFQNEIIVSDKLLRRGLLLDITEQKKSNLIKIAEINHALKVALFKEYWNLKSVEEQEKFIQSIKQEREIFFEKFAKEIAEFHLLTWDYIGSQYAKDWKGGKGNSKEDKEFVKSIRNANELKQEDLNTEVGAKWLFYASAMAEMYIQFKRDIDNHIVKNKEFIQSLEK